MLILHNWARRWGLPQVAINELMQELGAVDHCADRSPTDTEDGSQIAVRLEASKKGDRLWRNNVGAGKLQNGRFIRWGICNESHKQNKEIKSSDLIGIRRVVITQEMVGAVFGQFLAREIKRPGWRYRATEEEVAQLRFLTLVLSMGGDAAFATGEGTL